jgi:aspartate-semialdehyde dehydrogenase
LAKTETLALIGGDSLMAREMRDLLAGNALGQDLKLVASDDEEPGKLTVQGDEPAILSPLDLESLEFAAVVLLAGSAASTRKALEFSPATHLVDLTYAAEEHPGARLRAPMVEIEPPEDAAHSVNVIANAAAIALATVLGRAHGAHKLIRAVALIFEPASERGAPAVDELHKQSVSLLSFKGQPKEIFDAQLAFNLLARYGEEAPSTLEESELRIERHLATLLSNSSRAPMPSIRLIQAPVFHGYSISLWVEFESSVTPGMIEQALSGEPVDLRTGDLEPANVVGMAGQQGIAVTVAQDRNNSRAAWIWMVTDNLRLRAENAVAVAHQLL